MSYRWGLPHLAYFKALASETGEHTATWRSTLAGLAAMRLVDAWAHEGGGPLPAAGIQALERAIKMMDVDADERAPLTALASALCIERSGRNSDGDSPVLVHVRSYAEVLWKSAAWTLATDCCRTIIRHARTRSEHALLPLTYDRLGRCLRARAQPDAALDAFQTGRALASARGDLLADLQLRISEASLELQRGNDTAAECLLDEVMAEATFAALPGLVAQATHDRGVLYYLRGDTSRALELYLRAFAAYGADAGAERVLADIALVWQEQGHREIARDIFESLAAYSTEHSQRSAARINLMRIAVSESDEPFFEMQCRTLARASLSVRHEAHYYLFAAEGWLEFGRPTLAKQALDHATDAVCRGRIGELETRLSSCQHRLEALTRERKSRKNADAPSRIEERTVRSTPIDFQLLMARTSAAAVSWRGGRESTLLVGY